MDLTEGNTEEILMKINAYKQLLCQTDYKTLKYVDGALGEEEYSDIKAKRAAYRSNINRLEEELEKELEKLREAQSI